LDIGPERQADGDHHEPDQEPVAKIEKVVTESGVSAPTSLAGR
jgi:hypothetical protein